MLHTTAPANYVPPTQTPEPSQDRPTMEEQRARDAEAHEARLQQIAAERGVKLDGPAETEDHAGETYRLWHVGPYSVAARCLYEAMQAVASQDGAECMNQYDIVSLSEITYRQVWRTDIRFDDYDGWARLVMSKRAFKNDPAISLGALMSAVLLSEKDHEEGQAHVLSSTEW